MMCFLLLLCAEKLLTFIGTIDPVPRNSFKVLVSAMSSLVQVDNRFYSYANHILGSLVRWCGSKDDVGYSKTV